MVAMVDKRTSIAVITPFVIVLGLGWLSANFGTFCCVGSGPENWSDRSQYCESALVSHSKAVNGSFELPEVCFDAEGKPVVEELEGYEAGDMIEWEDGSVVE